MSVGVNGFDMVVSRTLGKPVMQLSGELDFDTVPRFRAAMGALLDEGEVEVTIDLRELEFIDSKGLGALVGAFKRFRAAGGNVILSGPSRSTMKVLEISGLSQVFDIEPGAA